MMKFIFILILTLKGIACFAQPEPYPTFFSRLNISFADSSGLPYLNKVETSIIDSINNGSFEVYNCIGTAYNYTRITNNEIRLISSADRLDRKMTNNYECLLNWNATADTGYAKFFSRIYNYKYFRDLASYNADTNYQIVNQPVFFVPLLEYKPLLGKLRFETFKETVKQSVIKLLHLQKAGKEYFTENALLIDSPAILPQAPLELYLKFIISSLKEGLLYIYSDPSLSQPIKYMSTFDSLTSYPFLIISQNDTIKTTAFRIPVHLTVINTWKMEEPSTETVSNYDKSSLFKLTRHITAIGIKYDNGNTVFFDYQEIQKAGKENNVYLEPFNQLFIGASVKDYNIKYTLSDY